MGDPRKIKSKYNRPGHPWQKERIEEECALMKEYGLKNKTEIYKARSKLKTVSDLAKKLIAARGSQAEKEKAQLLARLARMGLLKEGAQLDDVLGIELKNLFERRLQTIVLRKGLAKSIKQSRQLITHEHIMVGGRTISSPSYNVPVSEEASIAFVPTSSFANTAHPERTLPSKAPEPPRLPKEDSKMQGQPRRTEENK